MVMPWALGVSEAPRGSEGEEGAELEPEEQLLSPTGGPGIDPTLTLSVSSKYAGHLPLRRVLPGFDFHLADCQSFLLAFVLPAPTAARGPWARPLTCVPPVLYPGTGCLIGETPELQHAGPHHH